MINEKELIENRIGVLIEILKKNLNSTGAKIVDYKLASDFCGVSNNDSPEYIQLHGQLYYCLDFLQKESIIIFTSGKEQITWSGELEIKRNYIQLTPLGNKVLFFDDFDKYLEKRVCEEATFRAEEEIRKDTERLQRDLLESQINTNTIQTAFNKKQEEVNEEQLKINRHLKRVSYIAAALSLASMIVGICFSIATLNRMDEQNRLQNINIEMLKKQYRLEEKKFNSNFETTH